MHVAARERRPLPAGVDAQDENAGALLDLRFGSVVEERDRPVRTAPRVVLPGEPRPRPHREVALLATEPPDDRAIPLPDLVDGARVPGRDEERAVRLGSIELMWK